MRFVDSPADVQSTADDVKEKPGNPGPIAIVWSGRESGIAHKIANSAAASYFCVTTLNTAHWTATPRNQRFARRQLKGAGVLAIVPSKLSRMQGSSVCKLETFAATYAAELGVPILWCFPTKRSLRVPYLTEPVKRATRAIIFGFDAARETLPLSEFPHVENENVELVPDLKSSSSVFATSYLQRVVRRY